MTDNDATQMRQDDATKQLRAMLDERGVEWKSYDEFEPTTQWETHGGAFVYWARERDGKLLVETTAPTKCSLLATPAQAIAATDTHDLFIHESRMNKQTCIVESMHGFTDAYVSTRYFVELSCHTIDDWGDSEPPKFCPYCGRKVVSE